MSTATMIAKRNERVEEWIETDANFGIVFDDLFMNDDKFFALALGPQNEQADFPDGVFIYAPRVVVAEMRRRKMHIPFFVAQSWAGKPYRYK